MKTRPNYSGKQIVTAIVIVLILLLTGFQTVVGQSLKNSVLDLGANLAWVKSVAAEEH